VTVPPTILDGKSLAASLEREIAARVARVTAGSGGRAPALATILVGDDPASATYVRMKGNACRRVGMESVRVDLPASTTTEALLDRIGALNADPAVHGILLQHPVPRHVDERRCFDRIRADKDVDGVTALGFGRMSLGESAYGSATPAGIMRLLAHHSIPIAGKHAVVVGRGPILGRPMAMMLLNANATVTICHSHTADLAGLVRMADLVVAAVGKPRFIRGDWIRPGAVVVDAGYHPGNVGDVDLAGAAERASAYTPVPGGVGPMTIATLLEQTITAAERAGAK
jgi:methylenetetrahydrofolate dehydrogenase (NADP+) / methenyltetrahydrofolate cyclohydrolase